MTKKEYMITLTIYKDNLVEEERKVFCTKEEWHKIFNKYFQVRKR